MKIDVSNGEIIDRLTIVEIKLERVTDSSKLENLRMEFRMLDEIAGAIIKRTDPLYRELYKVNSELWDIENKIRKLERKKDFGKDFVETARAVYFKNDIRSEIKRKINLSTGSALIEEKSYEKY